MTLQFEKPGQSCRSLVWQSLCFNNRSRGRYDSFPNHHYLWQLKTNYCPVSEPARYLSLSSDMPSLWRKGEATSVLATAMLFSLKIFHHKVRWNKYPILNLSAIYSFLAARGKEGKASMYTNSHCIWIASSFFYFFPFFFPGRSMFLICLKTSCSDLRFSVVSCCSLLSVLKPVRKGTISDGWPTGKIKQMRREDVWGILAWCGWCYDLYLKRDRIWKVYQHFWESQRNSRMSAAQIHPCVLFWTVTHYCTV